MVTRDRLRTLSFLFSSYVFRFCRRIVLSNVSPLASPRSVFCHTIVGKRFRRVSRDDQRCSIGTRPKNPISKFERFAFHAKFSPLCSLSYFVVFSIPVHLFYVDRFERFVVKSRRGISSLHPVSRIKVHFKIDRHLLCPACNDASD